MNKLYSSARHRTELLQTLIASVLVAATAVSPASSNAQQYFVKQTKQQCTTKGGYIVVWTNTAGVGTPVGECYVPPKIIPPGGVGASGGYSGGGFSGGNRSAAALGATAAFLGLFVSMAQQVPGQSAESIINSEQYQIYQRELQERNAALNRQTGELQDFVRSRRRDSGTITGGQCNGYPETYEGVSLCQSDIAATLEQKAAACGNEQCQGAFFRGAATARCTAGFSPSPGHLDVATVHCTRYPGDYERLQQRILAEFPWANDPDRARNVVRDRRWSSMIQHHQRLTGYRGSAPEVDVEIEYYENDRLQYKHRATIDERCLKGDPLNWSICDLAWKAKDARDRGWAPDTPFNCGRARGEWEGDIVNGRCRLPGRNEDTYDPREDLQWDAKVLKWQVDDAVRQWRRGNVRKALEYARLAEQTFATVLGLTTTMDAETRAKVVDIGLSEIDRIVAALK